MKIIFSAHGQTAQVAGAFDIVSAYASSNGRDPDDETLELLLEGLELIDYEIFCGLAEPEAAGVGSD